MGRSDSAGSRHRRSVTCMKELLKHRLRPPPPPLPTLNLSGSDCNLVPPPDDSEAEQSPSTRRESRRLPSPQNGRHHLRRDRYRDTPIYFEPGSPLPCWKPDPANPGSDKATLINDYEEAESADSRSLLSANFSLDSPRSVETYATSVASRSSGLSLQCKGQIDVDHESALEWKTRRWCSSESFEYMGDDEETESNADDEQQCESAYRLSGWGTPTFFNESFNACATPLAPAKAHIVDVIKSSQPSAPLPASQFSSSRRSTPTTPHRQTFGGLHSRQGSDPETPKPSSSTDTSQDHLSNLGHSAVSLAKSPTGGSYSSRLRNAPNRCASTEPVDDGEGLVDAISSFVDSFPENMLTLDAPCIVELRQRNRDSCGSSAAQRPSRTPYPNSHNQFEKRTRSTSPHDPPSNSRPFLDRSALPCIDHTADMRAADLGPLRTIFPESDDWWRGLLYAHLVAYNHITKFRVHSLPNQTAAGIPPPPPSSSSEKRKMIPRVSVFGPPPSPPGLGPKEVTVVAPSLGDLEDSLASCITCISSFMAGRGGFLYGESFDTQSSVTLIRSLAEVVRSCEGS